jgi:nucleoside-diphosphate-sugar epimerase
MADKFNNIVIFGCGYIGSELSEQLAKRYPKAFLTIVDKEFKSYYLDLKLKKHKFEIFNIRETTKVEKVLENADLCFPLAALVEAETSNERKKDIFLTNYRACLEILKICTKNKIKVVFPSTTNVYGSTKKKDLKEFEKVNPKFAYAIYKRKIEEKIFELKNQGLNATIARIATNYGHSKGMRFNLVINLFVKKILLNEPITIFGTGDTYRPYIHVKDTAQGLILLAEKGKSGEIYNLGGENFTINELIKEFIKTTEHFKLERKPDVESPFSYHVNFNKIAKLGFKRKWNINKGIKDLMKNG